VTLAAKGSSKLTALVLIALLVLSGCNQQSLNSTLTTQGNTYRNPLEVTTQTGMTVESCADPTVIRSQQSLDRHWYLYCTTDPLSSDDRDGSGNLIFHLIPIFKSLDLVHWTYVGDAFTSRPSYAVANAGLWAPEIQYLNGQYYLYYTVTDTTLPGGGSAIGVATSNSPTGPWTHNSSPAVEPHPADCCPGSRRWVFDPEIITASDGQNYIYYGSYFGGISVRELSDDGLSSDPATQTLVAIANRYEGASVVQRDGYYYLFASATDCCRGPLTGYSVFVGRSQSPLGPFLDREGVSFLEGRVGGTPVISMNGNRWVGPGHNDVFTDFDGQDWFLYHAIDRTDPYFEGEVGFTKRPVLLDPLDWIDGWPTVRAGHWASDLPQAKPAAQPGQKTTYKARPPQPDRPGKLLLEDTFSSSTLNPEWVWVRQPDTSTYNVTGGNFVFQTQAADLFVDSNNASVLTRDLPSGNYVLETRVKLDVPAEGCCFNFVQAGLVVYENDDNFIKLVHVSIWETRQTEFAKEEAPVPTGYPRYGNTVVTAPGEWTYLRVVKEREAGEEHYTAYTSRDGTTWTRGGTWTHDLGRDAQLGLVSMGGSGFTAEFDYVRVYRLNHGR
jgi:arabinan endo-1,5-alpha-L-arabinosidase